MKTALLVLALLFVPFLFGCASSGNEKLRNESQTTLSQKLTKGVTTKDQVQASLGAADNVSFTDGGNEIWKYYHVISTAKGVNFIPIVNLFAAGVDQEKKELVILFDDQGVVKNFTFAETQGELRQGVFAK